MKVDQRYQPKQFVGEVKGKLGHFRVFESGDPRYYLFESLSPTGCSFGLHFPVLKHKLKDEVKKALRRHGYYESE